MTPTLSLVMPLYQGAAFLPRVLAPLVEAQRAGDLVELIVVDDGSTDGGPERARELGARVLAGASRGGPADARNRGAREARGDVLLFIDADVAVPPDLPARVAAYLREHPEVAAVFGSYDDRPAAPGWVSRYRNLLHHHVHQTGREEARTFWAGCGAVRRSAFEAVGGFDAARFPHASIEDIELGMRLHAAGYPVRLRGDLQATHLKRWTFRGMVATDVTRRALPWSRLLLARDDDADDLNLAGPERAKALLACGVLAALAAAFAWPALLALSALLLALLWLADRRFLALCWRAGGPGVWLAALVCRPLYYLYSVAGYAYCRVEHVLGRAPHAREAGA